MGGRINTIMQTCFFAIIRRAADATRRSTRSRTRSRRPTARRGEAVVQMNLAAVDQDRWHTCTKSRCLQSVNATCCDAAAACHRRSAASLFSNVTADDDRRARRRSAGQRAAGRRHIPDRHRAMGEAQHRAGDPGLGRQISASSAASASMVCPHAVIRTKVYDPPAIWRTRRRPSSHDAARWPECKDLQLHDPGRAGGLHRLRALRRGLPGQEQDRVPAQGASTWSRSRRCAKPERDNWDFFLNACRSWTRARSSSATVKRRAAAAAAVRVLRRLRRLRRDALPQAAHAALRRSRGHRQRDRLFLHLRRQPADDAVGRQ